MTVKFYTDEDRENWEERQAQRIFTDREEPRAAFWSLHERLESELRTRALDIHVLSYYGFGGIGKTSLSEKLLKEIQERDAGDAAYYDFKNSGTDAETALSALRASLEDQGFRFPLFDAALFFTKVKLGQSAGQDDPTTTRSLLKRHPMVAQAVEVLGLVVPGLETAVKLADKVDEKVRGLIEKRRKELRSIAAAEPRELKSRLPEYFGRDLDENIKTRGRPLTIFFDTYEKLVDPRSENADYESADLWIRGTAPRGGGVIVNAPGVLWVILGREKLCWEEKDPDWKNYLESHNLGRLSQADAMGFLQDSGMADEALRQRIYTLTDGWPLYLDLCMDIYDTLLEEGRAPALEDFGSSQNDLAERLWTSMTASQRDCVTRLACLAHWSDDLAGQVVADRLVYSKVKRMSFVSEADGVYCMHSEVCGVLENSCEARARQETLERAEVYYKERLAQADQEDARYIPLLLDYVACGVKRRQTLEELEAFFDAEISVRLNALFAVWRWEPVLRCAQLFLEHEKLRGADCMLAARLLSCQAAAYRFSGQPHQAKERRAKVLELRIRLQGEQHPDTLAAMCDLAESYNDFGELKAETLWRQALELRKKVLGEKHPDTIFLMSTLARANFHTKPQEVRELCQQVLALRLETLGEDHPDTIIAMRDLAVLYSEQGEYQKAEQLWERMLELAAQAWGENHPHALVAMYSLAELYSKTGKDQKSLAMREKADRVWQDILEEKRPGTVYAMLDEADTYYELEGAQLAGLLWEKTVELATQVLGAEHPDTIAALYGLACSKYELGDRQAGEELMKTVLELRAEVLGEYHPDTAKAIKAVALLYFEKNELHIARDLWKRALELQIELLGKNHPDTIDTLRGMEKFCPEAEANEAEEQVLTLQTETFGATHEDTLKTMLHLSRSHLRNGEYQQAREVGEQLVAAAKDFFGKKHPNVMTAMGLLIEAYTGLGEYEKAKELLEQRLTLQAELCGSMDPYTMRELMECYAILGEHQKAEALRAEIERQGGR